MTSTSRRVPSWPTRAQRQDRHAEQSCTELKAGLTMGLCCLLTLTKQSEIDRKYGHDLNLDSAIRADILTKLNKHLRARWNSVQVWSVVEWGKKNEGVHLHAVLRNTAGITVEWVQSTIQELGKPYIAHLKPIHDGMLAGDLENDQDDRDVAMYLTKQLRMKAILEGWPPYFHSVSKTRDWLPRMKESKGRDGCGGDSCEPTS